AGGADLPRGFGASGCGSAKRQANGGLSGARTGCAGGGSGVREFGSGGRWQHDFRTRLARPSGLDARIYQAAAAKGAGAGAARYSAMSPSVKKSRKPAEVRNERWQHEVKRRKSMKVAFRTIAAFAALCLFTALVAVRADAPKTETVTFPNGTGTVSGFLATPEKPGRYPALVVVHEWWGLTDWVKEQTQKLAGQGYIALAVDLYRGKVTSDPEEAHELMRGLPQDRAISDLQAAFVYLAGRKDVDRDHIGTIG